MPESAQRIVLHLPILPRTCFAILGFGLIFTFLFLIIFPHGLSSQFPSDLTQAVSGFRLSQPPSTGCGSHESLQGRGIVAPWNLPQPNADRGIYKLKDGFYFDVSRFQRVPFGQWKRLVPVMQKLAQGSLVKIMVFGGSFTLGGDCWQSASKRGIAGKDCAWPARWKQWLHLAFPSATVQVENIAQGGSPSAVILGGIGLYNFSGVDLILVDTLVNDAHNENKMLSAGSEKWRDWDGNLTISVAFEELLRSLNQLAPKSALLALEAGCPRCIASAQAHRRVLDFYRIPFLDVARAVATVPELWTWARTSAHPGFKTHQAVADMLALSFRRIWDHMLKMKVEDMDLSRDFSKAFHPAKYRNRFPRCMYPCSVFSAFRSSTVQPQILKGNWTLYEDHPGKPGWISTEPASLMQVELCFRENPTFTFTYLRSYEKLGAGRIFLNGRNFTIAGKWNAAAKVSQSETIFSNAAQTFQQPGSQQVLGFNVRPNSTLPMVIENLRVGARDNKMKIIEIVSC